MMMTAYHPQSKGMVERMHQRLKAALVACRFSSSWPSELPWVLLGLRSMPLQQSAVSSAELVFGTPPTLPGQFLSTPELPPTELLDNLHHLMDPFILLLVHGPSPVPLWPHAFAACPLGSRVRVHLLRQSSSFPHTPV